jgi:hypothetical protein
MNRTSRAAMAVMAGQAADSAGVRIRKTNALAKEGRMSEHIDPWEAKEERFTAFAVGSMLLLTAAAFLSGPFALAACVIGGSLLGCALAEVFYAGTPDDDGTPASPPSIACPDADSVQQPCLGMEAGGPDAMRTWRERVASHAAQRNR